MDKEITSILVTGFIGAAIAALGFIFKVVWDYYYLKSPKLVVEVFIRDTFVDPPRNGFRNYGFEITIKIFNYSKNEAYGFEIVKLKLPAEFKKRPENYSFPKLPITDIAPLEVKINVDAFLEITENYIYSNGKDRLAEIEKKFSIEMEYYNALQRKYAKKKSGYIVPWSSDKTRLGWVE